MIEVWNRLRLGIWKRLLLVVNTLKEVVLPLCGVGVIAYLLTRKRKNLKTLAVVIPEIRKNDASPIKTGDLVKTINNWEGWITLGIAYECKDAPRYLCQFQPEEEYIYIQALNGNILNQSNCDLTLLGGYRQVNIQLISSNTEL